MSTTLPDRTGANSIEDSATTVGTQKTNLGRLRDFINDLFGTSTAALRTVWNTFRLVDPAQVANLSFTFSVGSSALTIAAKTAAGATCSATDPALISFRSATAGNGDFNLRALTAAQSLVISSGSTLGLGNSDSTPLYLYEIDTNSISAGTVELAISQAWLGPSGITSTTAEGGAGAADSASAVYSTTARTNLPFRAVARIKAPQTTAGTWAANPTECQLWPFDPPATSATQAQMEAASSTSVFATPGNVKWHPGVAKAWLRQSVSGGTPTLVASHNVSSITDNGAGDFTANFATAFSGSTAYMMVGTSQLAVPNANTPRAAMVHTYAAGSCRFTTDGGAGSPEDNHAHTAIAFFGDQ